VRARRAVSAKAAPTPNHGTPANNEPQQDAAAPKSTGARASRTKTEPDAGFVAVGRVLGPFGLKGELKVQSLTDNDARFAPKSKLQADAQPVTVEKSRSAAGHLYLTLKGFHDRSSVDGFRGALLQVPESDLPALEEGEHYRFQLIGLTVVTRDGAPLGALEEIIETGANDVYRVRGAEGSDVLLPALRDVIIEIDLEARRMVVDPPEWR